MYIKRISIENIRCFKNFEIKYDLSTDISPGTVIIGDNATGKSTFLRCVALGLCDESSAAGLMKESDEGYTRRNETHGKIHIELCDKSNPSKKYSITTSIKKEASGEKENSARGFIHERLSQKTEPKEFPWNKIFVCGYGTCRGASGSGDVAGWSCINAVYNLFNYTEGLQNPELMITRIPNEKIRKKFKQSLQDILNVTKINSGRSGIVIDGAWGKEMPLRDLADGYKSTFAWVADLIGWAIGYNPNVESCKSIKGILLIDEIENHLHPKWQKVIVNDIRKQFPNMQFITTTHSPLVASSFGSLSQTDPDKRLLLTLRENNEVLNEELLPMIGWRADQVLASKAFDWSITGESKQVDALLTEASILHEKDRNCFEESKYRQLKKKIALARLSEQQTEVEEEIDNQITAHLLRQIEEKEERIFGANNDKNKTPQTTYKTFRKRAAAKKKKE